MRHHASDLVAQVRVVASTEPTAIPAFVASGAASPAIVDAFLAADRLANSRGVMEALLLDRFERPDQAAYDALRQRFEIMRAFWHSHPLAERIHPAFAL